MEPSSPKKIQFAVPPLQGQLDPQAAEHVSGSEPYASEGSQRKQSAYAPPTMKELQLGVEQHLLGAGLCETDSQLSPVTAQLYAASLWANHNGPEETNGNEAGLLLANQERGLAESNSSGGKCYI
uniref:Uncharacterized protein n=1 Tax=Sphaeramia orbicularis TaxID=375764 RepID=A0A672YQ04_9TELE